MRARVGEDEYLEPGATEAVEASLRRGERRRWIDAQLVRLRSMQRVREGSEAPEDELASDLRRKEAHDRFGSYRELEGELELLAATSPVAHLALTLYVIEGTLVPTPAIQDMLDRVVDGIAARMPETIRVPESRLSAEPRGRWAHAGALAERNAAIRELGATLTAGVIARRVGLSKRQVQRVLADSVRGHAILLGTATAT